MKSHLPRILLALTALCTVLPTLPSSAEKKYYIRVVKNFSLLTPARVALEQGQRNNIISSVNVKRTADKKLFYHLNPGNPESITLYASIHDETGKHDMGSLPVADPTQLINKEILLTQSEIDKREHTIQITLKPIAPKKQKIRAYKDLMTETEWAVRITDKKGGKISESAFKKDTDFKVKKLSLQLNEAKVAENDQYEPYNSNIINLKLPMANDYHEIGRIHAGDFEPGMELRITGELVYLVDKNKKTIKQLI